MSEHGRQADASPMTVRYRPDWHAVHCESSAEVHVWMGTGCTQKSTGVHTLQMLGSTLPSSQ